MHRIVFIFITFLNIKWGIPPLTGLSKTLTVLTTLPSVQTASQQPKTIEMVFAVIGIIIVITIAYAMSRKGKGGLRRVTPLKSKQLAKR